MVRETSMGTVGTSMTRDELLEAWSELEDVLVDDDGKLLGSWRGYPAGTPREEIWLDFDEACPNGIKDLLATHPESGGTQHLVDQITEQVRSSYRTEAAALMDEGARLAEANEPFEAAKTYLAASHLESQVLDDEILHELAATMVEVSMERGIGDGEILDLATGLVAENARDLASADIEYFLDEFYSRSIAEFDVVCQLGALEERRRRADERGQGRDTCWGVQEQPCCRPVAAAPWRSGAEPPSFGIER